MMFTTEQFEEMYENEYSVFAAHMDYILLHNDPYDRMICDGDSLLVAAEDGYMLDQFREHFCKYGRAD